MMADATDAEARDGVTCIATRQVVQAVATAASAASTASTGAAGNALALAGDDDDEVLVEDASSEWERYCAVALDDEPSGHDIDEEVAVLQSISSSSAARSSSYPSTAAPSLSTTLAALDEAALLDDDECQL